MTSFTELDRLLSAGLSADYWSDVGIGAGAGLAAAFAEADWAALSEALPRRPASWRLRCAELLGDVDDERSLALLTALADCDHAGVREAALESLHALRPADPGTA